MPMALLWKKSVLMQRLLRLTSTIRSRDFCCAPVCRLTDDEVKVLFDAWANKHGKVYETDKEKETRFQTFKDKLGRIDKNNSTCDPSMKLGANQFSDWTRN